MHVTRRQVLAGAAAASVTHGTRAQAAEATVGPVASVTEAQPLWFGYPDGQSPAVAVKLGRAVDGGVGPDRDIVAYSAVCTHLGCVVEVRDGRMVCPCHFSMFDPAAGGQCYHGPAPTRLARIQLAVTPEGALVATGADGAIWGRVDGGER